MPIEVGIWRLGDDLQQVSFSSIESEARLEEMLAKDISIVSPKLMLIGRQIPTAYGKFIDMLAIDVEGNLSIIELKKNRTPREVVAQVLDYASWVENLTYKDIAEIYTDKNGGKEIEAGFADAFGASPPEKLNQSHELIIVASDPAPNTHLPGTVTPGGAFPTKLDVKAMTITVALMWSAAMLLTGIASLIWNGYAQAFLDVVASVYRGYNATSTLGDVIVGALYALLDGAVGGLVLAWLYNRLATH